MDKVVAVAAAVLIDADGRFLLAQRPARTVYAGYWEFPGGKVEPGEAPAEALRRELREELGVEIERADPWLVRTYTYPHATVRLHFFRVRRWRGEPHGREGQALAWQRPDAIEVEPMLPANAPILRALALPEEYAVSNAAAVGADVFLERLARRLQSGLRLVQLREPALDVGTLESLGREVVRRAHAAGARVLLNGDAALARRIGADGVHLSARELMASRARPDFDLVGASVHSAGELRHAEALGLDFAVLGSVQATPTHPDAEPLGWAGFERIARDAQLPVYAIGGMRPELLDEARAHGAHGIAMIRGSWAIG
ncbi:MAG: Nudix family hydrolase [Pseudomonadota bacterium]